MPILCPTSADGIMRDGSYLNPATDWTVAIWAALQSALSTTAGTYVAIWVWGDSAYVAPYVGLFVTVDVFGAAQYQIEAWDGAVSHISAPIEVDQTVGTWNWFSAQYAASTTTLTVASSRVTVAPIVVDLSTFMFTTTDEYVGTDTAVDPLRAGNVAFQYQRVSSVSSSFVTVSDNATISQYNHTQLNAFWAGTWLGLYAVTDLDDETDLSDATGHGEDFALVGSPARILYGPLDLPLDADTRFEDDFNAPLIGGRFGPWSRPTAGNDTKTNGCSGSPCFSCGSGPSNDLQQWLTTGRDEGTLKIQHRMNFFGRSSTEQQAVTIQYSPSLNYLGGTITHGLSGECVVKSDGALRVTIGTTGTLYTTTSSAGLVPVDGSAFSLQVTWKVDGSIARIEAYVNTDTLAVAAQGSSTPITTKLYTIMGLVNVNVTTPGLEAKNAFDNLIFTTTYQDLDPAYGPCPCLALTGCSGVIPPPTPPALIPIRVLRQFGPISDENVMLFVANLQVLMETGVGLTTGQGSDPQLMLSWSKDYGHTWSPERWLPIGKIGEYMTRVRLAGNLGQGRGWCFRVVVTDPIPVTFLQMTADLTKGTS